MYDEYKSKVVKREERRIAFLKTVKKHRVGIVFGVAALFALAGTLMVLTGIFLQNMTLSDSVYGTPKSPGARALFARVVYSAYREMPGEQIDGGPDMAMLPPGEYNMEARTENLLRIVRTQEVSFLITKRQVSVDPGVVEAVYGEKPDLAKLFETLDLAPGDRVTDYRAEYDRNIGSSDFRILSLTVKNAEGGDVSDYYDWIFTDGTIRISQRNITVTTNSAEKEYDRKSLSTPREYQVGGDGLAYNDTISISWKPVNAVQPGSYRNDFTFAITSEDGSDVTGNYVVKREPGLYTVTKIRLEITTPDHEKVYDGEPYYCDSCEVTAGKVLAGDTLEVSAWAPVVKAGEHQNRVRVDILEPGGYTTDYYAFVWNFGKVTVKKRPVSIESLSPDPITYDARYHRFSDIAGVTSGSLAPGDAITTVVAVEVLHAGTYDNDFRVEISSEKYGNVTDSYDIEYIPGKIVVNRRPASVTVVYGFADMESRVYLPSSFITDNLAEGDYAEAESVPFSVPTEKISEHATVDIVNYDWADRYRTADYDLTLRIEVNAEELERQMREGIGGSGGSGVNGGMPVSAPSGLVPRLPAERSKTVLGTVTTERAGQIYLRLTSFGDYNGKSWQEPFSVSDRIAERTPYGEHPLDLTYLTLLENGLSDMNEVTVNDLLEDGLTPVPYYTSSGWLERLAGRSWTDHAIEGYDTQGSRVSFNTIMGVPLQTMTSVKPAGEVDFGIYNAVVREFYLTVPGDIRQRMTELLSDAGVLVARDQITAVQKFILSSARYETNFKEVPADADPIMYFLTESKSGICAHFASAATMAYRTIGIPARYVGGFLVNAEPGRENEYSGINAHAWVEIYLHGVGWVPVEVTPSIQSGAIPENLEVLPDLDKIFKYNVLAVQFQGKEKTFDGEPLYSDEVMVMGNIMLDPGVRIEARSKSITRVGSVLAAPEYLRIIDSTGKDITDEYEIFVYPAELTVNPLRIDLEPAEIYVGQTLPQEFDYELPQGAIWENAEMSFNFNDPYGIMRANPDGTVTATASGRLTMEYSDDLGVDREAFLYEMGLSPDAEYYMKGYARYYPNSSVVTPDPFNGAPDTPSADGRPELIVSREVTVRVFEHLRIMDSPPAQWMLREAGVSDEPEIIEAENGKSLVKVLLASGSKSKPFDGEYLTNDALIFLYGRLLDGHKLEYTIAGAQLYAGTSPNHFRNIRVVNENGRDVTDCYVIEFYPGELTVVPAVLDLEEVELKLSVNEALKKESLKCFTANGIESIPIDCYTLPETGSCVEIFNGSVIGMSPGKTVIGAYSHRIDLNNDGAPEVVPSWRTIDVEVVKYTGPGASPVSVLLIVAVPSLLAGGAVLLMLRRKLKPGDAMTAPGVDEGDAGKGEGG